MKTTTDVRVMHGEEELFARMGHLFAATQDFACAANDAYTWARGQQLGVVRRANMPHEARKLYRPGTLLDPTQREHIHELKRVGAQVRITPDELNETIILDRKVVVLASDQSAGRRTYGVVTRPEVVHSVTSLFNAAWRRATDVDVFETEFAEARALAPRILEVLTSGCKDETAARTLGLGLRTYRRRVAELMAALGATSRFQAGVRARELGLV